jgi:hypothetical protein
MYPFHYVLSPWSVPLRVLTLQPHILDVCSLTVPAMQLLLTAFNCIFLTDSLREYRAEYEGDYER